MLSDANTGKINPLTRLVTEAFEQLMRSVMVCLPGYVVAFDPSTQFAQVQCGIQKMDLNTKAGVTIPVIENVPVQFSGSGAWYQWHEVLPGCEGMLMFSQRALDMWLNTGELAPPHDMRMFSAKDAFFVPGLRSKPNAIPGFKNEGIGMSDYAGANYIHIKNGSIDIVTPMLNVNANTATTGTLTNNGKNVGSTHAHVGSPTAPTGGISPTGVPI